MTSTGNDIVSLNAINIARTKQYRFYSKILSPAEKDLYNQAAFAAIPFENFVWLLWSIKESAYKYLKRNNPGLVFIPLKFVVTQLISPSGYELANFGAVQIEGTGFAKMPIFNGVITFGNDTLYSVSLLYRELIASVVNNDEHFDNIGWGVKLIERKDADHESTEARRFLISRLQQFLDGDGLAIVKNSDGIPIVLAEGKEQGIAVSLSHHGGVVGYSVQVEDF